jgi:hypothetical protein
MQTYRAEKNSELIFNFPNGVIWSELDRQGVKLPVNMKFVDLVIERDLDILLVEIKDPSHSRSQDKQRNGYLKGLKDNSILTQELTPKARDSYLYLHLMERDRKPLKYIVLLALDAFDPETQKGVLSGFKDRLFDDIRNESFEAWKRKHITDCAVLSVESWNQKFPEWPVRRERTMNIDGYMEATL